MKVYDDSTGFNGDKIFNATVVGFNEDCSYSLNIENCEMKAVLTSENCYEIGTKLEVICFSEGKNTRLFVEKELYLELKQKFTSSTKQRSYAYNDAVPFVELNKPISLKCHFCRETKEFYENLRCSGSINICGDCISDMKEFLKGSNLEKISAVSWKSRKVLDDPVQLTCNYLSTCKAEPTVYILGETGTICNICVENMCPFGKL